MKNSLSQVLLSRISRFFSYIYDASDCCRLVANTLLDSSLKKLSRNISNFIQQNIVNSAPNLGSKKIYEYQNDNFKTMVLV